MNLHTTYLNGVKSLFKYYRSLAEKSIAQVEPEQIFLRPSDESNSIAIIVQHMAGNMISRWTDFKTTDGEKAWRNRDEEFMAIIQDKDQLMQRWEAGWECFEHALDSIYEEDLQEIIYIRNEGHSIMDALNRQLAHYSYHVGQIVFIAKMLKQSEWSSLSIPLNKSASYNSDKFLLDKGIRHFTSSVSPDKKIDEKIRLLKSHP
ncbi:MAG: DUF1572 family protein [Saprospiraceae bacterium]|nr:DUF1572 family protein [Candidatus Vicinibacter affinis]